jgi:RHS repeat-associated protein
VNWRSASGLAGRYISPRKDFGTLVKNGDGSYTYTAKDKITWHFSSQGQLSSIVDTHGLTLSYSYDGSGRLVQVSAPDASTTILSYDPTSHLPTSITEPGPRTLSVQHDGSGNLTQLTDVDQTTRTFSYDGVHHLTRDQWSPLDASFTYDPSTGLLTNVNRGLGTTYAIVSAAAGTQVNPAGAAVAQVTDGRSDSTQYVLDGRGRLLQQVQTDGATDTYYRDGHGQVTLALDPLVHPTTYSYDYGAGNGDLTQVSNADGSWVQYQYDPTFHHLSHTLNSQGETSSNTYDPATGDLLTSTDGAQLTTTYVWANGLLLSTTAPNGGTLTDQYDAQRRLVASFDNGVPTYFSYDANGNPASTTDALRRTTTTVYSPADRLLSTIGADTSTTSQTYNAYGEVTSVTTPRDVTTTTYDQRGFAVAQADLVTSTTTSYDAAGNITQTTDGDGNPTSYQYDSDNRQTATFDAYGTPTTMTYDLAGDLLTSTDAYGHTTTNRYDLLDRLVSSTDTLKRPNTNIFDQAGNIIGTIDATGLTINTYDQDNRLLSTRTPGGETTRNVYDRLGHLAQTLDALGKPLSYFYDADNRPVGTLDSLGLSTATRYDLVGEQVATIDQRGKETDTSYNNVGEAVGVHDPDHDWLQTLYDAAGNVAETIDANSKATLFTYDAAGRQTAMVDGDHYLSRSQYDAADNLLVSTDNNGQPTTTVFDKLNRAVLTLDPNGHWTQTVYDALSEVVAFYDGDGHPTYTGYDGDGEQTLTQDANGARTTQSYNAAGQLTQLTDPDTNTTSFYYDANGNQVARYDALGHASTSTYDADNRLLSQTDRNGRTTQYSYDSDGRLLQKTWLAADGHTVVDTFTYTYDNTGNLVSASNHYGGYSYSYDDAGRMQTQTDPFGLTLTYSYDGNGNTTQVVDSLGGHLFSTYDADNRLTNRQFAIPKQVALAIGLSYTPDGQLAGLTRYSDLGSTIVSASAYTYDNAGNLTHLQHRNAAGGILADYVYTYDNANQLLAESDNGTGTNYGYDLTGQLTVAGTQGYSYDANGNRTMSGYQTGPNNELLSDPTWSYSYDAEGNVTAKRKLSTGETWTYGYDNANQLVSAVHKDSNGVVQQQVTLQYDVFGDRVEEDVLTTSPNQLTVQKFAYDGSNVWAEFDGSNNLVARHLYLDGANQVFARITAGSTVTWDLTDHLGSVRVLTDNTGAVLNALDYDAFGNVVHQTNPTPLDLFGYAGYVWDASVGLNYVRARWYDPASGRWISQDLLGLTPGPNPYDYVRNAPTNATDPSGLISESEIALALRLANRKSFNDAVICTF